MALDERMKLLERALARRRDSQERLAWVVARARWFPALAPSERLPGHEIPGCASRLWLLARIADGDRWRFRCDSESAILKSVCGQICELYDGATTPEVRRGGRPWFLEWSGLSGILTENRRRTIRRFEESVRCAPP